MRCALVLTLSCAVGCGPSVPARVAPGSEAAAPSAEAPPEEPATVALAEPPAVVEGLTVATDPRASAVVISEYYELLEGSAERPLRPDAEGRLVIPEAAAQAGNLVLLWAPGRASQQVELPAPPAWVPVELAAATVLRGHVTRATGRIEHVWLHPENGPPLAWPHFVRADVDGDGRFVVRGLAAGRYRINAVPLGGAPVLAADATGAVRFLAEDPGQVPPAGFRFLDPFIDADGAEHDVRAAFGDTAIRGRVVDEAGQPVAGATVQLMTEAEHEATTTTDASGAFSLAAPPAPHVLIRVSHPDYGDQGTDREWRGWIRNDTIPDGPIEMSLRRGVVLRGRVVDERGAPVRNTALLLIPAYVGSGPRTVDVRTDAQGRFTFARSVLRDFELVPGSLSNWHERSAGEHRRVRAPDPRAWVEAAGRGASVELVVERYRMVPATAEVRGLQTDQSQVWLRWGPDQYLGSALPVREGRVTFEMERGVPHELWIDAWQPGQPLEAPWTARPADWSGTPTGPTAITLPAR
ncbi:MAG: carboxypeptidase regulatory-like domain-containing protein [Sandaracinaceae bacterium]|nr:carboxypeptidase regulatory-like domain-containing protein [Sandaracinaceae bacterium]